MHDSIMDELEADGETVGDAAEVGVLAARAEKLLAEVEAMEAVLKDKQKELRGLLEHDLPSAMDAANCKKFETTGGKTITVQDIVRANIPKDRFAQAFAWLRDNGHADLIKHEIKVSLGREQDNVASELIADVQGKYGVEPTDKVTVHAQTLSAFCREQLAAGNEVPAELLGLYTARHAKLK